MLQTFIKKQGHQTYEVPIIFPEKPDKALQNTMQQIIDDTHFEGDYYDRVRLFTELEAHGYRNYLPMTISERLKENRQG